jgi:uncharacterized OB-fold protein
VTERRPDRTMDAPNPAFWAFCNEGRLCLQECQDCGQLAWPVVEACLSCGGRDLQWRQVSGNGSLASWCAFERRYYGELLPPPWDCILVELEEGPLFISNPRGFTSQDAYLHMPVRLCFLDCEDRWGPFKLPVFERREPDPPDHRLASRGEPQSPLNSIYIIDFLD